ncbi:MULTISPECIES: MBL fold metallo-hydrolase [Brevibacillus]|uniref:MBL fold metallo-hydrolase n=1 Tax=Brevibacillus invocatus TaxID=173959 RepID=A0A3M8BWH1_9BACL|nr:MULTISPECIES: MBL fold metallo-hydrolase [Brevibacillus]MCM3081868.1 MBL fold metallo-hydrolase [Brevibacillus invocatus]MCM3432282.1 MBL fold metallo-hydrolase [Brevibacillus invocatus]MDH4619864.1 MBL fold metallo-hydrolase [Brevibacillus sp. AY1]RNB67790.1 MBL fold metallo-hydrolase [Brevibacillus invocatus]
MLTGMTAKEVAKMVKNKEDLFILDVRNQSDYQDWKIEGEKVSSINVPYFDLLDGVEGVLKQLPTDNKLLVVCAKEGSSKFVAEQLVEAGLQDVSYLEGGMKSWSEHLEQVLVYADEQLKVYQYLRMGKGCLSYMVISGEEALVVDPSRFTDVYMEAAKQEGAKITHIVDSHLHADHISGGKTLADQTGAAYYMMKSEGAVFDFMPFEEHDRIRFAHVDLRVLAVKTPGHTPGSVSFFVNDKLLFSGDTIFVGGLGRPDLGGKVQEWAKDLYDTVYEKIAAMADDVIVLPGHYANLDQEVNAAGYVGAELGAIRAGNELMNQQDKQAFVDQVVANAQTETPPNFEEIIAINRGVDVASPERQQELEIGPNRCALHHTH